MSISQSYNNVSQIIIKNGNHTPLCMHGGNGNDVVMLETFIVNRSVWGQGSGYVSRIHEAVRGKRGWKMHPKGLISLSTEGNGWRYRTTTTCRVGGITWLVTNGLVIDCNSGRIVMLVVHDDDMIGTILVDKTFDHVTVHPTMRTMRKHVRKGLALARQEGLRIQHVSPSVISRFTLPASYNGNERRYGHLVNSVRENLKTMQAR